MSNTHLVNNPWDHVKAHDVERFGTRILDEKERALWCGAIMTGGLPYLWGQEEQLRNLVYNNLELRAGARVLLIGESNESCNFDQDIKDKIGPSGELRSVDIIEKARDMCFNDQRGANGKLGTWEYTYTHDDPEGYFDAIAVMQGVQHCENWHVGSAEMLRVLKPGGMLVLAEITHGACLLEAAKVDVHLEYYIRKLYMGLGQNPDDFSYWSLPELNAAFSGKVVDSGQHAERGFEIFWGRKPA